MRSFHLEEIKVRPAPPRPAPAGLETRDGMDQVPFKRPRLVGLILLVPALALGTWALYYGAWHYWTMDVTAGDMSASSEWHWNVRDVQCDATGNESAADILCPILSDDYTLLEDGFNHDYTFAGDVFLMAQYAMWGALAFLFIGLVLYTIPQFQVSYPPWLRRLSFGILFIAVLGMIAAPVWVLIKTPAAFENGGFEDPNAADSPARSFWGSTFEEEGANSLDWAWRPGYGWFAALLAAVFLTAGIALGWTDKRLGRAAPPAATTASTEPEPTPAEDEEPQATGPVVPRDLRVRCPDCKAAFEVMAGTPVAEVACPNCGRVGGPGG